MSIDAFVADLQKKSGGMSYDERRRIATDEFNLNLADQEFFSLPYDEQNRIREKFIGMVAPVKEMVAGPEDQATGEAYRREMKAAEPPAQQSMVAGGQGDLPAQEDFGGSGGFFDTAGEETIPKAKRVADAWRKGDAQTKIGLLRSRQLMGEDTPEIRDEIEKLKKSMPPEFKGDRSLIEQAFSASAEMLPTMAEGIKQGATRGAMLGAGFAGMAAVAGQTGPQVALPEEAVTVPVTFATGYTIGQVSGSIESIGKIEAGLAYDELLDLKDADGNRLDPTIAKSAAAAVGVVNGAIEMSQIGLLLKTIPGADKLVAKAVNRAVVNTIKNKTLHGVALRAAGKYGGVVAAETGQEILQESTNILATEVAKEIDNESDIPAATRQDITKRLLDTAKQSALAFSLMAAPGTAVSTARDAKGVLLDQGEEAETPESLLGVEPLQPPDIKTVPPGTFEKQAEEQRQKRSPLQPSEIRTAPPGTVRDQADTLDAEEAAAAYDEEALTSQAVAISPDVSAAVHAQKTAPPLAPTQQTKRKYADLSRDELVKRTSNLIAAQHKRGLSEKQAANLAELKAEMTSRGITPADESAAAIDEALGVQEKGAREQASREAIAGLTAETGKSAQQSAQDMLVEEELLNNRIQRERLPQARQVAAENPDLVNTITNLDKAPSPERAEQAVAQAKLETVERELGGSISDAAPERLQQAFLVFRQQRRPDLEKIVQGEQDARVQRAEWLKEARKPADKGGPTTLGGFLRAIGGINPTNQKSDLSFRSDAASKAKIFSKTGVEMEKAKELAVREGWMLPSDDLEDILMNTPDTLKRGKLNTDTPITKNQKAQAAAFQESATAPDEMPPDYDKEGAYRRITARDLPEGSKVGLVIDGRYDRFTVVSNDVFGDEVVLRGTDSQFSIDPSKMIEVSTQDLPEQAQISGRRTVDRGEADRRTDTELRAKYDAMSNDERFKALYEDSLTGLGNRRAYNESPRKPAQVSIDADGLKWVNDTFGHKAGDELIRRIADGLKNTSLKAYHPSGDEFWAEADENIDVDGEIKRAKDYLSANPVTVSLPDGTTKTFVGAFSYGKGRSQQEAEQALKGDKAQRELSGERRPRGAEPPGVLGKGAEGRKDSDRRHDDHQEIDTLANEAATSPQNNLSEPTEAQKEAGNYKKGHVQVQGMDITIENPRGSTRSGVSKSGKAWRVEMKNHYGYFKRSEGKDGDQIDVFLGPHPESAKAFIVDQIDPEAGKFDEHKVIMGVDSEQAAKKAYLDNYETGWKGLGAITEISTDDLKEWVKSGRKRQPYGKLAAPEKTKMQKAAESYKAYIESLTDDQRAMVADLIQEVPKQPAMLEWQIKKAVAARSKKAAESSGSKTVENESNKELRLTNEPQDKDLSVSGQRRNLPGNDNLWYTVHKNLDKSYAVTIGHHTDSSVARVYGQGDTAKAAYTRAVAQLRPDIREAAGEKKLTFDEFEKAYRYAFEQGHKYTPGQAGFYTWSEKMAELSDEYPEWAEAVENKQPEKQEGEAPKRPAILEAKAQTGNAAKNIARLLYGLGIQDEIMAGEDFHRRIKNPPWQDLVIERHQHHTGPQAIYLTHYREQNGDLIGDGEMVFAVMPDGRLRLIETAVQNAMTGGEMRANDYTFANIFAKNLIAQGFDKVAAMADVKKESASAVGRESFIASMESTGKAVDAEGKTFKLVKETQGYSVAVLNEDGRKASHMQGPSGHGWGWKKNEAIRQAAIRAVFDDKAPATPIVTKFEIGDTVRPKPGSGVSEKNGGRVQHIRTHEDGSQHIKTENSGNLHFKASDFEIVEKEHAIEAQPAEESITNTPSRNLAAWVKDQIDADKRFDWRDLFEQANKEYGGTQAQGKYTPKDAYDAMEMGVNLWLTQNLPLRTIRGDFGGRELSPMETIDRLKELISKLPTQTKRTEEQQQFQQFSTPPPLAFAANWVANLQPEDVYLEPSAGIGGLAIFAKGNVAKVHVNELSKRRAELLKALGFENITTENAEQLDNILPEDVRPTVIVMNPPFSSTAGRVERNKTKYGAQHVEQALARLEDGGRLVAIVGRGMADNAPIFHDWWTRIKKKYNVRANIGISGADYTKYGTSFDNQILVIDKTGPSGQNIVKGFVDHFEDLPTLLKGVRDERQKPRTSQPPASEPVRQDTSESVRRPTEPKRNPRSEPAAPGDGERQGGSGATPGWRSGAVSSESDRHADLESAEGGQPARPGEPGQPEPRVADRRTSGEGQRPRSPESNLKVENEAHKERRELTDSIFESYRPKAKIEGNRPHPTPLVESAAMADTEAPDATYSPSLPKEVIQGAKPGDPRGLSEVQFESVIYAGQSHAKRLPSGARRGFFIGDGTGVGKGREISGILRDNWEKGRKKAVWISESWDLINDAERDLRDSRWDDGVNHLFSQKSYKLGASLEKPEGILFTTYSTLRGGFSEYREDQPESFNNLNIRLNQLVNWLGKDFDGVIAFDESHNMANAAPKKGERGVKKPSQMALAGIALQRRLPEARVVYVSATGATEVENLVYADRLGLWGEGTPFNDSISFVNEISRGGIATMELIARNMKSLGLYLARSLSYDQVKYDRLTHTLDKSQAAKYDELARAWQSVLHNIDEAVKITGSDKQSANYSAFWGAHQRFFNQIITTMQMPTAIDAVKKDVEAGNAVVLQLVNTDEAQQERALNRREEGQELEDLDMTPRENLMAYLENSFPIQQFEEYTDENGTIRKRPVYDDDGKPVINREAKAMRDQLLSNVASIVMPNGPLDFLIQELGHENVAEVTGRGRRIITNTKTGKQEIEKRSSKAVQADVDQFLDDKKQVLVFSGKGATGRSFHADKRFKNQRPRKHYLIQPGWRADKALQGLGRTHRSNEVSAPEFILVTTNLKGQARFLSSIARRLDQLGALTKGERKTGSQGIFQARDNLESDYATEALTKYIEDVVHGKAKVSFDDFESQTGLVLVNPISGGIEVPPIVKFLNRLLSMEIDTQNMVFDEFSATMDRVIQDYADTGRLDVGIETITGNKVEKVDEQIVYTDQDTGALTKYVQIDVTNPTDLMTFDKAQEHFLESGGFYRNKASGRVWISSGLRSKTDSKGNPYQYRALTSPHKTNQIKEVADLEGEKWEKLNAKEARKAWQAEYDAAPKTSTARHHLITGNILPIWNRLTGKATVYRMQTDDGERYLGRVIPTEDLQQTMLALDIASGKVEVSPEEIKERVMNQSALVRLSDKWAIRRAVVSGDERIEVIGPDYDTIHWARQVGLIVENIQYRNRYFIPTNGQAAGIIKKVIDFKPIISIEAKAGPRLTPMFSRRHIDKKGKANVPSKRKLQKGHDYGTITEAAELLRKAIEDYQSRPIPTGTITEAPQAMPDGPHAFAQRLAAIFGKQVTHVYNHRPDLVDFDGVTIGNNRIYLNATSKKPHMTVVGHELLHELRRDHEDLYFQFLDAVRDLIRNFDEYQRRMDELTKREGVNLSEDRAMEELLADFVGDQMGEKEFWDALAKRQPSIFQSIVDAVKKFLLKIINRLQVTPGAPSPYIKDIQAAREAAADAFAEYAKRQAAGATAARNKGARLMSAPKADKWYSQMRNVIAQKMTNGPAAQVKATLESWAKKGEFKAEELEWSGLLQWFEEQNGKVIKQQVLNYLDSNAVQVIDVEKSADSEDILKDTKFSQYQLPGGENYKELLLTLPQRPDTQTLWKREWETFTASMREKYGYGWASYENRKKLSAEDLSTLRRLEKLSDEFGNLFDRSGVTEFHSSHWSEPNVLAHVRFNDRTSPNGKKMLFIEEIQSDWHQKGRKSGYKGILPEGWVVKESRPTSARLGNPWAVYDKNGQQIFADKTKELAVQGAMEISGAVPDAPWKKTWPMLAFKRMVRYAAENGFDAISWTPGDVQAERYDLSKHLKEVRIEASLIDSPYHSLIGVDHRDRPGIDRTISKEDDIADYIGKDAAEKLLAQEWERNPNGGWIKRLSGLDLKIGGEGMKGFYDRILPAEVNAFFGKKVWGHGKVVQGEISTDSFTDGQFEKLPLDALNEDGNLVVHSLPITPEMRQKALREGMPLFARKNDKKIDHAEVLSPEVQVRMKAARGVPLAKVWERIVEDLKEFGRQRAHFPSLQKIVDKALRAKLNDLLRIHQEIPETVKLKAIQMIQGLTRDLSKDGFEVYRMNIILADMARDINKGLLDDGHLPFGFKTKEEVLKALDDYKKLVVDNPEVSRALTRRNDMINGIKERLVKAKLLKREVLDDEDYFHHQVLQYWTDKYGLSVGSGEVRTKWRPWMAARKGSALDYNTEYVEAEFMAVSQQLAQLETVETLKRIKAEADIYSDLKYQAKDQNWTNLWEKLRAEGRLDVDPLTGEEKSKELQAIKAMIAWSNEGLGRMAAEDKLEYDSDWSDFVQALADAYNNHRDLKEMEDNIGDVGSFGFDDPRWFHFLSYLLDRKLNGANYSATIFKAIKERDRFIKNELGDNFLTFQNLIPEGYTTWKPEPGKGWFWASTVTESMINRMIAGELDPKDAEFRKVLARGRELIWVIPQGLAETMDKFYETSEPSWLGKKADWLQSFWKQYILLNPYSVLRYNLNNMSGDLDICLAYAPEIASKHYAFNAAKDLLAFMHGKEMPTALKSELTEARRLGVIGSGFSVQEVNDVLKVLSMDGFVKHAILQESPSKASPKTWIENYWKFVQQMTGFRENVLRLAAYRFFKENADKRLYGVSKVEEVNAIEDKNERAAKLARELLGDYGNISKTGEWLRKRLIPFYSWLEINAPRYVYMMRNSKYENRETGSAAGRVAAVTGKRMVMSAAKLALRANILYGLIMLWNMLLHPDEEEELGESGRRQLHLILGRREDGSIMTVRFQGAWSDALSFFGLEDWPQDVKDVVKGGMSLGEKTIAMAKDAYSALVNRGVQSLRPDIKSFGEVTSGYTLYPDVFTPRPVRDRVEHLMKTFKLDSIYRSAMGRPSRGKTPGAPAAVQAMQQLVEDLTGVMSYDSDPGEMAYYDTRSAAFEWLEKKGDEKRFGGRPNKKGNALYWYKQAMKFGDIDAAHRYLTKYYELGGTPRGRIESIRRSHPLASIPKKDRFEFRKSLNPDQERRLKMALDWYKRTYLIGEMIQEPEEEMAR
jgi:hypothetical protein